MAIHDDEHADHQLGINRRTAHLAVVRLQSLVHIGESRGHKSVDAPEKVVLRDTMIEPELVKRIAPPPPPRRPIRLQGHDPQNQRNHCSAPTSRLFRQHRPISDMGWRTENSYSHDADVGDGLCRSKSGYHMAVMMMERIEGTPMLTLYDFGNSVCCQKVRITMSAKGLNWEPIKIDLFKTEQYDPKF